MLFTSCAASTGAGIFAAISGVRFVRKCDTVEVRSGQVLVNGKALDEPYLQQPTNSDFAARSVESGRYFVMGDNRNNSSDSRAFGSIIASSIVGRAWIVYWPPADWGSVPHYAYTAMKN